MDKLIDICHECQQHNSLDAWIETTNRSFLSTVDPRLLWLKYQILIHFKDWSKTMKLRPGVYKKSEKQNMLILSQIYKGYKNQCTYCHRTSI